MHIWILLVTFLNNPQTVLADDPTPGMSNDDAVPAAQHYRGIDDLLAKFDAQTA